MGSPLGSRTLKFFIPPKMVINNADGMHAVLLLFYGKLFVLEGTEILELLLLFFVLRFKVVLEVLEPKIIMSHIYSAIMKPL